MDGFGVDTMIVTALVGALTMAIGIYFFGFASSGDGGHTKDGTKRNRIVEV